MGKLKFRIGKNGQNTVDYIDGLNAITPGDAFGSQGVTSPADLALTDPYKSIAQGFVDEDKINSELLSDFYDAYPELPKEVIDQIADDVFVNGFGFHHLAAEPFPTGLSATIGDPAAVERFVDLLDAASNAVGNRSRSAGVDYGDGDSDRDNAGGGHDGGEENPSYGTPSRPSVPTFDETEYVGTHDLGTGGTRVTTKVPGGYTHEITSPTGSTETHTESDITYDAFGDEQ